jgi:hypothetical protein
MFNFNSKLQCFYLAPDIKKKSAGIQDSRKITITGKKRVNIFSKKAIAWL